MTRLIAGICVAAQLVGLVATYWMFFEFFTLPDELLQQFTADTETAERYLAETFASWQPWPFLGFVGAFVGWLLILNGRCRDAWFLAVSRVLAWIWLPLIPVGTVIGALVLRARAQALRKQPSDSFDE